MTSPVSNISRTNLNALDPNLATGQVADPALRKACFDEIYSYFDTFVTSYNAFIANGGIGTANLADLSVTTGKLALLAVTAAQIANGTITANQLADSAVTSAKILDGTIANTDINASAAIDATKIANGAVTNTEFQYLDGVTSPIQTQLNAKALNAFPNVAVSGQTTIAAASGTDTLNVTGTGSVIVTTNNTTKTLNIDVSGVGTGTVNSVSSADSNIIVANGTTNPVLTLNVGNSLVPYAAAAGTANVYTATLSPALGAYTAGVALSVNINITNTGASTINVNGLGAKPIVDSKGNAMTAGKLTAAGIYTLRYNGTAFILQGEGGDYGTAVASQVLAPNTIGTPTGIVSGTMPNNGALNYTPSSVSQTIPLGYTSGGTIGAAASVSNVQRGNVILAAASTNITISAVDLTKAIVVIAIKSFSQSLSVAHNLMAKAKLTNATTLNISLSAYSATYQSTVSWQVIEFNNVKSLQTGEFTSTNGAFDTIAISTINPAKAFIFASFTTSSGTNDYSNLLKTYQILSATQIELQTVAGSASIIWDWQVIEFN